MAEQFPTEYRTRNTDPDSPREIVEAFFLGWPMASWPGWAFRNFQIDVGRWDEGKGSLRLKDDQGRLTEEMFGGAQAGWIIRRRVPNTVDRFTYQCMTDQKFNSLYMAKEVPRAQEAAAPS